MQQGSKSQPAKPACCSGQKIAPRNVHDFVCIHRQINSLARHKFIQIHQHLRDRDKCRCVLNIALVNFDVANDSG